ncbi:spore coat protein U domain-containing protein [Novosphingobium cyanobacteriorum]|uniref:Spore coat protein U domain-containing protein n=1 Tax=Novosphingobium cyanobacteriorum TaxID=3024215 RepID=A0ABT6CI44_9SPHN|nr:spore coat protein U domain-containing protein [Novosphingobium cyanobacteriorum]MDF8332745.1 spore coat protein U domain-containing protein [Novosphingobium cyanobacteriorum]
MPVYRAIGRCRRCRKPGTHDGLRALYRSGGCPVTTLRSLLGILAPLAISLPGPAKASCAACSCSASATNLNFGTYDPARSTPTQATSSVSVNCFSFIVLMVGTIDIGLTAGTSGTATTRTLANGTSRLNYNVYEESALINIWGGLGNGGLLETLSIAGLLTYTKQLTAYGSIPPRQWVKPGTYSDSVVVTVMF